MTRALRRRAVLGALSYIYYFSLILLAASIPLLGAGIVGVVYYSLEDPGEQRPASIMLLFGSVYALLGVVLSTRPPPGPMSRGGAILLTAIAWTAVPTLTALPLSLALGMPYVDALFESIAGWTTTGLTILTGGVSSQGGYVPSVDELPETVKLWRSLMQWEGGVGIVVFTVAFLARPGVTAAFLYQAEGRLQRLEASFKRSAVLMAQIYIAYTVAGAALLYISGMGPGDALLHSMTAISTAGFSTRSESIGYYGDPLIYASTLVIAFLGATSFRDLHALISLRLDVIRGSAELRAMILLIAASSLGAYLLWARDDYMRSTYSLVDAVYNALSALSTVGFSTADISQASDAYKIYLAILGMIGGSAFSTAGGIKILRILVALKAVSVEAEYVVRPRGYVVRRSIGFLNLDEDLLRRSTAIIVSMIGVYTLLLLAALALYSDYYRPVDLIFEVASAVANIGLSSGVTSPEAPLGLKVILGVGMLLGRLEVIPYIIALKHLMAAINRGL